MKICLVFQHYPPEVVQAGIGTPTWNKARAVAHLGRTVHVLSCTARPGPDLRTQTHDGVTVNRLQPPRQEPGRKFPVYPPATHSLGYAWSVLRHRSTLTETVEFPCRCREMAGERGFVVLGADER